jgi:ATP-binding cassette subfamily C protein
MNMMWHFARTYPRQTLSMLIALLLAGVVEGIGLTALLPMLNLALDGTPGETGSGIGGIVTSFLRFLGVTPSVGSLLLVVMAGVLLKSGLVLAADKKVGYTVAHVATDLRLALLHALMGTRWEYYLTQPVGRLANSASTEVMRASQAYLHGSMTLTFLIQSVVYTVIAMLISWQATIVALLASLLLLRLLNYLVRKTKQAGRKQTRYLQSLLAHLTDSLQSAKPLKAMGREQLAEKLLETDTVRLNKALRKQVYSKALRKSLQGPIMMMLILSAFFTARFCGTLSCQL